MELNRIKAVLADKVCTNNASSNRVVADFRHTIK